MLVVDTGVLVAAADRSDRAHPQCLALLQSVNEPLVTTGLVIAESAYLIERELGSRAEALLFDSIVNGALRVLDLVTGDWERIRVLITRYEELPLGGTDASVVALAERLGETRVATLDRRYFSVVRPLHCDAFELVP